MDTEPLRDERPAREDTAARMAHRAGAALEGGDDAVFSADLDALCAYLETDYESLLAHEEAALFPLLEARGLGAEVEEAKREHRDLRRMCAHLASECPSTRGSARHVLGVVARLLAARP